MSWPIGCNRTQCPGDAMTIGHKNVRCENSVKNSVINTLRPSAAIWGQRTESTLAQVMA